MKSIDSGDVEPHIDNIAEDLQDKMVAMHPVLKKLSTRLFDWTAAW